MATTPKKLSDAQAKKILLEWPAHSGDVVKSTVWPTPHSAGAWLRAQPPEANVAGPRLNAPGAKTFNTQPDGLWTWFGESAEFVDLLAIEVCGSAQNLNDKRARYAPTTTSAVLRTPIGWLKTEVRTRGGRAARRLDLAGLEDLGEDDLLIPVRWLNVLYALPNDVYGDWTSEQVPAGHEYFCRHSSLGGYSSQKMQEFLARLTLRSHFLTEPGK